MLCASGFVDDDMFSHNGMNGTELKSTRMFRHVRQVAARGRKSAVSDCILLLVCHLSLFVAYSY